MKEGSATLVGFVGAVGDRSVTGSSSTVVASSSAIVTGSADDMLAPGAPSSSFEETLVSSLSFLLSGTVMSASSATRFLLIHKYTSRRAYQ